MLCSQVKKFQLALMGESKRSKLSMRVGSRVLWTDLPISTYSSTVRRMMATAEEMAIRTTWLFSLEMEKAAEGTTATGNKQC